MRTAVSGRSGLDDPLDILLADVAIRIQLSRIAHGKAEKRYEAVRDWIEREGSPLADRVELFYPQGSMALGAAIASRVTNDEYDLDVVAQLDVPAHWSPKDVLDTLYQAIRGDPGSRYHDMAERHTRCVTVSYADMHLDVTPMERDFGMPKREGDIFHDKEDSAEPMRRCVANPYGFAEWFNGATADGARFAEAYLKRASAYEMAVLKAAEADPVPAQEPAGAKTVAVVALQLIKRWRNIQYRNATTRKPPSVMLSEFVGKGAGTTETLSDELLHQVVRMRDRFLRAAANGVHICVANPVCPADVLTDRWPADLNEQKTFLATLESFVRDLERLKRGCDLPMMSEIFVRLFGEGPTHRVFEEFARRDGEAVRKGSSRYSRNGTLIVPGVAAGIPTRRHRFYGGPTWWE